MSWIALVSCGAPDLGPGVAARIDGRDVPYSSFSSYLDQTTGNGLELESTALASLFESFLEEELLFSLAVDRGLLDANAERSGAPRALLASIEGTEPSEEDVLTYHRDHPLEFRLPERVRLEQILVQDEAVAQEALRDLRSGMAWSTVAARVEREEGAVVGDQGEFSKDELPEAFVAPVFSLGVGDHTDVLSADYGFHLFRVTQKRAAGAIPLAEARPKIERQLRRQHADRALAELLAEARERYTVLVADQNLPFERSPQ